MKSVELNLDNKMSKQNSKLLKVGGYILVRDLKARQQIDLAVINCQNFKEVTRVQLDITEFETKYLQLDTSDIPVFANQDQLIIIIPTITK